jgi:hypothetical protein
LSYLLWQGAIFTSGLLVQAAGFRMVELDYLRAGVCLFIVSLIVLIVVYPVAAILSARKRIRARGVGPR